MGWRSGGGNSQQNKIQGERDIPECGAPAGEGSICTTVAELAKADWLGSARLCEPNPRLGSAWLMNWTGSGQLSSRLALAPEPQQH